MCYTLSQVGQDHFVDAVKNNFPCWNYSTQFEIKSLKYQSQISLLFFSLILNHSARFIDKLISSKLLKAWQFKIKSYVKSFLNLLAEPTLLNMNCLVFYFKVSQIYISILRENCYWKVFIIQLFVGICVRNVEISKLQIYC